MGLAVGVGQGDSQPFVSARVGVCEAIKLWRKSWPSDEAGRGFMGLDVKGQRGPRRREWNTGAGELRGRGLLV